MCVTLEMTYFRAELVQLIVSRSDSELEVQRYSMKKNTLTVDPIMLQNELWRRQREKPSPNRRSQFLQGVSVAASPVLATIGMSVRPSVRLSVRHTLTLCENDAS